LIEIKHSQETSQTEIVTLVAQGMTIYLVLTHQLDGEKFLTVVVPNARFALMGPRGNSVSWTISKEVTDRNAAGASTTSNGSASDATPKSTNDIPDGEKA